MRCFTLFFSIIMAALHLGAGLQSSSLRAEDLGASGYYGFLLRLHMGGGASSLKEDFVGEDQKYVGSGPLAALQIGWAYDAIYAFYIGVSHFLAVSGEGPELAEPGLGEEAEETKHSYSITAFNIGVSWLHPTSALYIAPEIRLFQSGRRMQEQEIRSSAGGMQTETTTKVTAFYTGRSGGGITIGRDQWINHSLGIGFAIFAHYDTLLLERAKVEINSTGALSFTQEDEPVQTRNSVTNWTYGLSINIIIN